MMDYEIINNKGHYEVYFNGNFICSEDTYSEAEDAIEEHKISKNIK